MCIHVYHAPMHVHTQTHDIYIYIHIYVFKKHTTVIAWWRICIFSPVHHICIVRIACDAMCVCQITLSIYTYKYTTVIACAPYDASDVLCSRVCV